MKIKNVANIYLILALVLGALVPVMLKIASQNINIYEYLFLTYLIAMPASFIYVLFRKKTGRLVATMKNYKEFAFIAFLGLLNYGMLEYGLTYAEQFINTSLATAVYRTSPLLMLIFLPILLKERVSKLQLAALLLGFAGLYIALTGGSLTILNNTSAPLVAIVAGIALATAFVSVAVKRYSFDMEIAMFIFNFATFIFFAALFLISGASLQPLNAAALTAILYVGIVYNVFVGLMYYGALRMIKTTFVTNIYFLSPFITFIFSYIILGEPIYLYYVAIALLVAVGIIIQRFDKKGGAYLSKTKKESDHVFHDVTSAFLNTETPAIYDAIKSGGRVLAIKVHKEDYKQIRPKLPNATKKKLVYADTNKKFINQAQREFISDIMGLGQNELAIMCAGDPESSEKTLSELIPDAK